MRVIISVLLFISFSGSFAQTCPCDSLFKESQQLVEENYAGWFDKVGPANKQAYLGWTAKHLQQASMITTDSACAKKLQEWIGFFTDKHLKILFTKPRVNNNTTRTESKSIVIIQHPVSASTVNEYFNTSKSLDPIEGIYTHPSYELAITRIKNDLFYATVLTTKNENWKSGEVKLTITRNGNNYKGVFYEGDKSDTSEHEVKLADNILDFDIVFFEKKSPHVTTKRDLTEYEIGKDKDAPGLSFKEDVAIWKFPTFYSNSEEQTAYLLKKYRQQLDESPYWIIDLRNNSGGDYRVGWQLAEYIYTKPIVKYNAEKRMTQKNIDLWFSSFIKDYYEQANDKIKKQIDEEMETMRKSIGKMYNEYGRDTTMLTMTKALKGPKKIAILINQNTISSGELFTMLARQSDKVIVMGENSGGMMDYGNVLRYKTTYPSIRVQIPMDRMLWLNSGFSVDKEGLVPAVLLKGNNWEEEAIKILKK